MSAVVYLETKELYEIIPAKKEYSGDARAFSGAPRRHPYDHSKLLLVPEPWTEPTYVLEFRLEDVVHVEDQSSLANTEGESLTMVRIWVRHGAVGVELRPFHVEKAGEATDRKSIAQ